MKIYVKRENHGEGIWMVLPATLVEAEQIRSELEKQHPSMMMPFVAAVESRFSEMERGLMGELVFQGDNLETFNQLAGRLEGLSREEGLIFKAAYRMESPRSARQILETLGNLGSYRLHPEIQSLEELGRYLKHEEAAQLPEELDCFVDYEKIGRIWQEDHGFLTEGGFVEKREEAAAQAGVEEQKTEKREKKQGIFSVTLIRDSFKDRYVKFTLPLPEQELAEKKRQAGITEETPERVEISGTIDGLLEHLPPGSTLEELNRAAGMIEEMESCSGIDWKLAFAALEAEIPMSVDGCCCVLRGHKRYELLPFPFLEPESYAHYRLEQAGISLPEGLASCFDYRRYGQEKIVEDGVVETSYGVVINREWPIVLDHGEKQDIKLYAPLTLSTFSGLPMHPELLYRERVPDLKAAVRQEITRSMREYGKRGLAEVLWNQLLSRKISSIVPDVEERHGRLWGVARVRTTGELTDRELAGLKEEWKEIAAHGWGDLFSSRTLEEGHTRFHAGFWDTERGEDLCLLTEEELGKEEEMEDRFYYRELECYEKAGEALLRMIGKNDYFDLSLLGTETMKEEFRRYIRYRGTQVSLNTIQHEKSCFRQFCQTLQTRRDLPESLLDWEEDRWVQLLKAWMMRNGIPLTSEKKNLYGKTNVVEARLPCYIRRVYRFLKPEDERPEREKDIWEQEKLDIPIEQNPIYKTDTLNFTGILQEKIREEVKLAIYQHLKYEKLGTVKRELTSLRQFSRYLKEKQAGVTSCAQIDRPVLEEYLIHKATSGSSGRGNSDDILKLRSVLESVGKLCGYPHLEKLFLNTDIPPELEPEFRAYSDSELKRLNAHITKLDEQITRCMVIHQMLGTRISDTLTLQRDCLFQLNGVDMIRIRQVKTKTFEKPVSAELAALIRKAIRYTEERYGETVYIFVDERDTRRPLQYTTIKHKVLGLIQKEDLRDDEGKRFRFGTHMFRRSYGVKLTELHLDDWTIAKLLGHKGVNAVMHYRKMSNQLLADETRRAREAQTRILLANLEGWGEDYEQIR